MRLCFSPLKAIKLVEDHIVLLGLGFRFVKACVFQLHFCKFRTWAMPKKTSHTYFWEILFYIYFLSIISSPKSSFFNLPITPIPIGNFSSFS